MRKRINWEDFDKLEIALYFIMVTSFSLLIRLKFFPFESGDFTGSFSVWFSALKLNGGLSAIGLNIGDYMPTYLYLLAPLTYIPLRSLYLIKLLSFCGDVVLAVFAMRIVRLNFSKTRAMITYAVVLNIPTVVMNSAVWAQCDSIYAAALLACVYYVMKGRGNAAMASFAIAFVFKLQAVFLAPFVLLLLLRKKIRWRSVLVFPAVCLAAMLPALLMGRDSASLLQVYWNQTTMYTRLSLYLPNLSVWFPNNPPEHAAAWLIMLTAVLTLGAVLFFWRKKFDDNHEMILSLALIFALLVPYFLPHMHERYFYVADVLCVLYAFYFPVKFYIPVISVLSSYVMYCHYLYNKNVIHIRILSFLMLLCLIWVWVSTVYLARDEKIEHIVKRKWKG